MISAHRVGAFIGMLLLIAKTSAMTLLNNECLNHVFTAAFDNVTQTCWMVEKTSQVWQTASTSCNHLPGYAGHLGFPMTIQQMNFLSSSLSSGSYIYWVGLKHVYGNTSTISNKNQWAWVYPNGTFQNSTSGVTAQWSSANPTEECASPRGAGATLTSYACTTALTGFFCQYDQSTGSHETTLQHKCKQIQNWFWYEDTKSCITYSGYTVSRPYQYAQLACQEIPGYRGHLVHIQNQKKLTALMAIMLLLPSANTYTWIGLQQDATATGNSGWYWTRSDGYKLAMNRFDGYNPSVLQTNGANQFVGFLYNTYIYDNQSPAARNPYFCEYEETTRYGASNLEQLCAAIPNTYGSAYKQVYFKGTCYVRDTWVGQYDPTSTKCTHIPGFKGQLAIPKSARLVNMLYQMFTVTFGFWWSTNIGLRRNSSNTGALNLDWWWQSDGKNYSVSPYAPWNAGEPAAGYGNCGFLGNAGLDNWPCYDSGWYTVALCEYSEPSKGMKFEKAAQLSGKKTVAGAVISEYDDLPAFEMCGYQCSKEFNCLSFVHNQATAHCILQYTESYNSLVAPITIVPVAAPGYVWYDRF